MVPEFQTNHVAECRSFIAALCNITPSPDDMYINRRKEENGCIYTNEILKPSCLKTKQIFGAVVHCSTLLHSKQAKMNEKERQVLLKNLKKGLDRYESRTRAFFKIHWLRGFLFAWIIYRRISRLKSSIMEGVDETTPEGKQKSIGRKCQTLLHKIQTVFSTIVSVKDFKNRTHLSDFLSLNLEQIAGLRGESVTLPWKECRKVYKNIFSLQKEVRRVINEQLFRIQQKKEINKTKQILVQIKNDLKQVEEEFTQKLNSAHGKRDWIKLLWWIELYPSGTVRHLERNRFYKLSHADSQFPDAVKVSHEIADCIKFSQQLESSFRTRIECRDSLDHISCADFREMMRKHEEVLKQVAHEAQGNKILQTVLERLNAAIEKNAPELFFSLEKLPHDLPAFETVSRKAALLVHPDKHRNHQKAADTLFKIHQEIVKWIKQKQYKI